MKIDYVLLAETHTTVPSRRAFVYESPGVGFSLASR